MKVSLQGVDKIQRGRTYKECNSLGGLVGGPTKKKIVTAEEKKTTH